MIKFVKNHVFKIQIWLAIHNSQFCIHLICLYNKSKVTQGKFFMCLLIMIDNVASFCIQYEYNFFLYIESIEKILILFISYSPPNLYFDVFIFILKISTIQNKKIRSYFGAGLNTLKPLDGCSISNKRPDM